MEKLKNNETVISKEIGRYVETLQARRFSRSTVDCYQRALFDFAAHVKTRDVRAITVGDLEAYRIGTMDRGFKPASIQTYFQAIRGFFRYLEERQTIFVNPAAGLPAMRAPSRMQVVPTEDEMRVLLDQPDVKTLIGVRDRAMLETVYSTGIRRNELITLKMNSIQRDACQARVMGKGSKERIVPVGQIAMEWLCRYLAEVRPKWATAKSGEALWLAATGRPLGSGALAISLRRYQQMGHIESRVGLHSLRRACATHMLRRGATPLAIQALLGHATLDNLGQYLLITIRDLKRAHGESRVGQ